MRIDVITLFPELFAAHLRTSLLGRAVAAGVGGTNNAMSFPLSVTSTVSPAFTRLR